MLLFKSGLSSSLFKDSLIFFSSSLTLLFKRAFSSPLAFNKLSNPFTSSFSLLISEISSETASTETLLNASSSFSKLLFFAIAAINLVSASPSFKFTSS